MACVGWPRMGVVVDPVFTRPQFQPRNVDIQQAVNRFLGWGLPKDFSPDAGISFKPDANPDSPVELQYTHRPTGTNLFNADQAKAMFEYALHASFK